MKEEFINEWFCVKYHIRISLDLDLFFIEEIIINGL